MPIKQNIEKPNNVIAEQSVLGAMLLSKQALNKTCDALTESSFNDPNNGNRNNASILSKVMITPVFVSPKWNEFDKINGTILSYICQNEEIDMNANPINIVLL